MGSLEMIRALRKYVESNRINMKLFVAIRNAFVTILHRKTPTFHQRMLKKKALILLSKNRRVAYDMKPLAERILADSTEDTELKCEALRLLARAGLVGEEMTQAIIDLMQSTTDPMELQVILMAFEDAGPAIVHLVPAIISSSSPVSSQKWTLLYILSTYRYKLEGRWADILPDVLQMSAGSDPQIIRHSVELIRCAVTSKSLPEKSLFLTEIVDSLVRLNTDPNSMVRKDAVSALGDVGNSYPSYIPRVVEELSRQQSNMQSNVLVWGLLSSKWHCLVDAMLAPARMNK